MEEEEKVKRSDTRYKEVEAFKDYELTQCIAYEMAVRNPDMRAITEKFKKESEFNHFDEPWLKRLEQSKSAEEEKAILVEFINKVPQRREKIVQQFKEEDEAKKRFFFSVPTNLKISFGNLANNSAYNNRVQTNSQREQIQKSSMVNDERLKSNFDDDGTAKTVKGAVIDYSKLFPKFSRPLPIIPDDVNKEIDLHINLALPAKDILAYVETIKRSYDKSSGTVFQTASPLAEAQQIDKEIFTIQIKMKKKGSKATFDVPEKSQQEVYADLLFLYDVFTDETFAKKSQKMNYFHEEMQDYYASKVARYNGIKDIDEVRYDIGTPHDQTIRNLFDMMKTYIDGYGYKTLLA